MHTVQIEILVYIYLAVCLSMIAFNIASVILARRRRRMNRKNQIRYKRIVAEHEKLTQRGEMISAKERNRLYKRFRHSDELLIYTKIVAEAYIENQDLIRRYAQNMYPLVLRIIPFYTKKNDPIKFAFFLFDLRRYCEISGSYGDEILAVIREALRMPNTNCRENALQAVYRTGDPHEVVQALLTIDGNRIPHNQKLISDGLMNFTGNKKALDKALWDRFDEFGQQMQVAILDYIRFSGSSHRDRVFSLLWDENRPDDLRFSCIRYFGKYPDQKAYELLLQMADAARVKRWEYAAIACSALAAYPGERTVEVLKKALYTSDWYVRYNAAESLDKLGAKYIDLIDVIDGNDRYAREILQFRFDMRHNKEETEGAV